MNHEEVLPRYKIGSNTKGSKQCWKIFALFTSTTEMCTNYSRRFAVSTGKSAPLPRNTSSIVVQESQRNIRAIAAK